MRLAPPPPPRLQLKWVAAPLSYICAVALGVCLYHTAAEVGWGEVLGFGRPAGGASVALPPPAAAGAARRPLNSNTAAALPQSCSLCSRCPRPPALPNTQAPCLLPPNRQPQAGIVPEVLPELAKGAAAPFGLTSFALSTLLVLRCAPRQSAGGQAACTWPATQARLLPARPAAQTPMLPPC